MSEKNDGIDGLVAIGVIVLIGAGIYGILKSFALYESGDKATEEELTELLEEHPKASSVNGETGRSIENCSWYGWGHDNSSNDEKLEVGICSKCGTENPERCKSGRHCITCVSNGSLYGDSTCRYCGACLYCEGDNGGICNSCND